jgi:hypothetical protein
MLLSCGCVEVERVITLNPDGRGKMVQDAVMLADAPMMAAGPGQKDETLDQKKQKAVAKLLTGKGFTAWKDVSAEWTPEGRLHIKGTAYFERLDDLGGKSDIGESYRLTRPSEGMLKITLRLSNAAKKKPLPDLASLSGQELDDFLLKKRVAYQSQRPLHLAMLTDLKLKTVLHVPGDVTALKGFKKSGDRAVAWSLDGNAALKHVTAFMAQDNAALKKVLKGPRGAALLESFGLADTVHEAEVTVKTTGTQFDYDREVQAARAAYPALRERLKLDPSTKLPGEGGK